MTETTPERENGRQNEPQGEQRNGPTAIRPRRWRTVALCSAGSVAVAMAVAAGYWIPLGGSDAEAAGEPAAPPETAEITRGTIAETETWSGTLGRGDPFTAKAPRQGTITRMAEQDSDVGRGDELYRIDENPVISLVGEIPMYRDLAPGVSGRDVKQLERNLAELGYDGFTVDRHYTGLTANAVREWQADADLDETGTVARSDAVFVPESGTVDATHADVGGQVSPGAEVVDVTGSDPVATMEMEATDRDLVATDTEVTVQLPGDDEVTGTVVSASAVQDQGGGGGDEPEADDATVEVEVALSEKVDGSLLGSPVDIVVEVDRSEDVLVAPVTALLALSEGGHGLEVVAGDGTTSVVPVETGLSEGEKVEVSGDGIGEGTVVGVAER
ncbi:hypothetical protein F4561_000422 [Lipingzhangella halophila]|uniref:Peptidoglycan binding-like domain-containing protein n=1 Tax=Lipingzhangella halophila TaxID=1783352 RepID=A0A7W7RCS4_9ACTN|nr:peptidoglycan-binding protein [Lipingzhangella halophila]MBB4929602.1 hypothetical protein [Lipingzhangella halophila]